MVTENWLKVNNRFINYKKALFWNGLQDTETDCNKRLGTLCSANSLFVLGGSIRTGNERGSRFCHSLGWSKVESRLSDSSLSLTCTLNHLLFIDDWDLYCLCFTQHLSFAAFRDLSDWNSCQKVPLDIKVHLLDYIQCFKSFTEGQRRLHCYSWL